MITLLKSNIVGARDIVSIMYVELLFDIKTELPDKFYQINGKNFLIANGSLAIKTFINDKNENDTIVYKYNNGKWIKTADKYTGIITPISTITENGKYSIGSNNTIGTNNIDVDVKTIPVGVPKLLTPSSVAEAFNGSNQATITTSSNSVMPLVPSYNNQYIVFTKPIPGLISISDPHNISYSSRYYHLIFKCNGTINAIIWYIGPNGDGYGLTDANGEIISNKIETNKTYKLTVEMKYNNSSNEYIGAVGTLEELEGDITFTIE